MGRRYEQTHPWISFRLDLRSAPPELWLLLGEARSKCEHIANVPLLPETAKALHQLYLAKGVLASTAIEGNTLTEDQVLQHFEGRLQLPPSKQYLAREIDNVVGVVNGISAEFLSGAAPPLTPRTIEQFNREVLSGLDLEEGVVPGVPRQHSVGVGRYRAAPAEDCQYLLARLCEWLDSADFSPPGDWRESAAVYALLKAIVAHIYLAWIHPFGDGNGRTARLVEFRTLVAGGVPTPAAHLLSNHYNQTRTQYYRELDRTHQSGGELIPFLLYALRGDVDQLRAQLEHMHSQHRALLWHKHLDDALSDRTSQTQARQKRLALALSARKGPVAVPELKMLTPELAADYTRRTAKTLTRDLHALERHGLVERVGGGYRARLEIVQALLPGPRPEP
jgi:Fic family protein